MRERHGGQSESQVRGRGGGRWERIAGRNTIGQRSGSVWAMGQDGIVGHEGAWGSRDNEEGLGSVARGADGWEAWGHTPQNNQWPRILLKRTVALSGEQQLC